MMIVISDNDKKATLNRLRDDRIIRTACLDSIALISNRLQQKGANSAGNKVGSYSNGYAKKRSQSGRQTAYVDFTFTGEMIDSLDLDKTSKDEYAIGFVNKSAADKAEWNEARFGDLFALTDDEIELVGKAIENNVGEALRN